MHYLNIKRDEHGNLNKEFYNLLLNDSKINHFVLYYQYGKNTIKRQEDKLLQIAEIWIYEKRQDIFIFNTYFQ